MKIHGDTFSWLIPFPGNFHLLMNYQKVLMKIYGDAGLKQIAEASGFRGETLASLENCSNFTNTSKFFFRYGLTKAVREQHVTLSKQDTQ